MGDYLEGNYVKKRGFDVKKLIFITVFLCSVLFILVEVVAFMAEADEIALDGALSLKEVDVIVVFTGDDGRIGESVKLLQEGYGKELFISGVNENSDLEAILGEKLKDVNVKSIIIDKISKNTIGNVKETKKFLDNKKEKIKSIIIVTSKYHMVRSKFLLDKFGPVGVQIIYYSVDSKNSVERKPTAILKEFVKFYYYYFMVKIKLIG